jgi:hypothetical protein
MQTAPVTSHIRYVRFFLKVKERTALLLFFYISHCSREEQHLYCSRRTIKVLFFPTVTVKYRRTIKVLFFLTVTVKYRRTIKVLFFPTLLLFFYISQLH